MRLQQHSYQDTFDGNAKTVGAVSEYTGDFFVRTEAASGGMDEHLNPIWTIK